MKNQRRFAPTKTGRFAPEQVAAFRRNQWPESAEYALRRTISTPHDTKFARLEFGTYYKAVTVRNVACIIENGCRFSFQRVLRQDCLRVRIRSTDLPIC
jgi:hypothetical protein